MFLCLNYDHKILNKIKKKIINKQLIKDKKKINIITKKINYKYSD
jgi:hypothetical protein